MTLFLRDPNYLTTGNMPCPDVGLHHAAGQEGNQANLPFCRQTKFTHVNSMNSLPGMLWKSKWPPNWLSFSFVVSRFSPSLVFIHTWIQTYQWCGPKLKLKWMTDLPMKMDVCVCVCVCVCMYVCVYVFPAEWNIRLPPSPAMNGRELWP